LETTNIRYCGDPETQVRKVAVCGGTGSFLMLQAIQKGAQVFVTADVKHHEALQALDMGLCLVDGGHYATERPAMTVLARHLAQLLDDVEIAEAKGHTDPFRV
ncbi:MAG TPA: Nif3-like dinuclear metal center hexameric protein, partial [Peptococcaceae bacterium]|nr:Nif3-like dinuclear metal center hexameric protein [Peptococcaceae bacterium]